PPRTPGCRTSAAAPSGRSPPAARPPHHRPDAAHTGCAPALTRPRTTDRTLPATATAQRSPRPRPCPPPRRPAGRANAEKLRQQQPRRHGRLRQQRGSRTREILADPPRPTGASLPLSGDTPPTGQIVIFRTTPGTSTPSEPSRNSHQSPELAPEPFVL